MDGILRRAATRQQQIKDIPKEDKIIKKKKKM